MCQSRVQNDHSIWQCFFFFFFEVAHVCPQEKRTGWLAWVEAIMLSNAQATAAFLAVPIKLAFATTVMRTK